MDKVKSQQTAVNLEGRIKKAHQEARQIRKASEKGLKHCSWGISSILTLTDRAALELLRKGACS